MVLSGNALTSISSDAKAGDTKGERLGSLSERYDASNRSVRTFCRHFSGLTEAARFRRGRHYYQLADETDVSVFDLV